jgi:hypothetical protein
MPPALLERHGIDPEEVAPVNEAFSAGDIERALDLTPDAVAERIMVAGTPDDWVQWLTEVNAPIGLNHALLSFTDPLTLKAWAHLEVPGLPDLVQQVRLFDEHFFPDSPRHPHNHRRTCNRSRFRLTGRVIPAQAGLLLPCKATVPAQSHITRNGCEIRPSCTRPKAP